MANLKDIRRRIKTVKSTQKITQAMKMVAAAKVKRAEARVKANRPYTTEMRLLFEDVYEAMKSEVGRLEGSRYGELLIERPIKNLAIVVLSSDRGLCGAYNANVTKQALLLAKHCVAEGITPKFYVVGNKLIRSFKSYCNAEVLGTSGNISSAPSPHDAHLIATALTKAYQQGDIDGIQILYTQFQSMISYKVTLKPVFPLKGVIQEASHLIAPELAHVSESTQSQAVPLHAETLLEPSPVAVLDTLIPKYLGNQLYNALLESSASELAARVTAMSNASNNASDMIGRLTIQYNKVRQASITQELLEIVGGAEALT